MQTITKMVNENFTPTDEQETVLEVFKEGRDSGQPWGRANPLFIREQTELKESAVQYALRQLATAGWITKRTEGLYELNHDPRETNQ